MFRFVHINLLLLLVLRTYGQLAVARDTVTVLENGYVLKMPWANGLNYVNVSQTDLNNDGKKDLVIFDRSGTYGGGRFKCFINKGNAGQAIYRADPDLSYFFPKASNWALLRDYDCDGREDLFCSTTLGIKVYKNTTQSTGVSFALAKPVVYSDYNPSGTPYISNLYASPVGMPGIADINGDGYVDILTFSSQGVFVEYHQNRSVQKYGKCDSLEFGLADYCWGDISESNCEVDFNACPNQKTFTVTQGGAAKVYHAGSCLTCMDSDGDGDKDLLMGDVVCNSIQYVHNTGSTLAAVFTDTTKIYPNYPNKNSTNQIRMNNFPCAYYVDVNNDGRADLLASPNAPNSENYKSVWYYNNISTTGTVNFQFVKNNFLQDEMIDVGQNSFPVLIDYNADGKKDLLIGNFGYYMNNSLNGRLTLYENIGTATKPVFSLVTRDYAGLSAQNLNNAMPTVGDVDGDGDVDICVGVSTGQVHWIENTAGSGQPCNFTNFKNNPFTFTATSGAAAPQLFDLDADGKLDLLVGTKNGKISFYKNTSSSSTSVSFSLVTNNLGGVDVKGDLNTYGTDGFAVPFFYLENGTTKLLVGSVSGKIYEYTVASVSTTFSPLGVSVNNYNEGEQSAPCYEDVNGDGKRDLFIGNTSGGLAFFSSTSPNVGLNEDAGLKRGLQLYPNPVENELSIQAEGPYSSIRTSIMDFCGREILRQDLMDKNQNVDLSNLPSGIYFVRCTIVNKNGDYSLTKKIIKR